MEMRRWIEEESDVEIPEKQVWFRKQSPNLAPL